MKKYFVWKSLIIIIFVPIAFYINNFGITLSNEHIVWAEFGSYISGIYGPIFSVGSIILLWFTIKKNKQSSDKQLKVMQEGNFEIRFNSGVSNVRENSMYQVPDYTAAGDAKLQLRQALSKYYTMCQNDDSLRHDYIGLLWEDAEHYFMSIYYLIYLLDDESVSKSTLARCRFNLQSQLTAYEKAWSCWLAHKWISEDFSKIVDFHLNDKSIL